MQARQVFIILCLFIFTWVLISCNKIESGPNPIPVWEDNGADSCSLTVTVQTKEGIFLSSSYVSLALSQDSLNKGKEFAYKKKSNRWKRKGEIHKALSRKYYGNSITTLQGQSLYGSFRITLPPSSKKDTVLIVY